MFNGTEGKIYFHREYLTSQPMFVTAFLYDNEYVKVNGQLEAEKASMDTVVRPPARPPFPGCRGRKTVLEEELRDL